MMRVLVTGGRNYGDQSRVWRELSALDAEKPISAILQGGASGADAWAVTWGHSAEVPVLEWGADWEMYGRGAGPMRNEKMLREGKPDLVVAFPGGRGTADMVRRARSAGIPVKEVTR